jgi:hypothetical protein
VDNDTARLVVAIEGMRNLLKDPRVAVSRNQLFALPADADDVTAKALRSKGWQRTYVERMMALGLIEKVRRGNGDKYLIHEVAPMVILRDWIAGHGAIISRLVYPEGRTLAMLATFFIETAAESLTRAAELAADDPKAAPVPTPEDLYKVLPPILMQIAASDAEDDATDVESAGALPTTGGDASEVGLAEILSEFATQYERLGTDLDSVRGALKRQQQSNEQVVASAQGALRALQDRGERKEVDRSEVVLETLGTVLSSLNNVLGVVVGIEGVVGGIEVQVAALDARLAAAESNHLGRAVATAEAALEVLADAAGDLGARQSADDEGDPS